MELGKMRRGNLTEEGARRPARKEMEGDGQIVPMVFDQGPWGYIILYFSKVMHNKYQCIYIYIVCVCVYVFVCVSIT